MDASTICPICDYRGYSHGDLHCHLASMHRMTEGQMIELLFALTKALTEEIYKLKEQIALLQPIGLS